MKLLIKNKSFYMDGYLMRNLDTAKTQIKKDWDMIFVIDGSEGSGKSVLSMQMAFYCDPTFDVSRICFTPADFKKAVLSAEKYQAVQYDEAYAGLASRSAMSTINKALVSMLAEIRQKNLFIFVVLPCFFDLDKYVALWRSRGLIHVTTGDQFERGFFSFYNADRKKDLYMLGKKYYNYYKPVPNFRGRFTNAYVIDEEEYRKKKLESLQSHDEEEAAPMSHKWKAQRDVLAKHLIENYGYSQSKVAEILTNNGHPITRRGLCGSINRSRNKEQEPYTNLKYAIQ